MVQIQTCTTLCTSVQNILPMASLLLRAASRTELAGNGAASTNAVTNFSAISEPDTTSATRLRIRHITAV